MKRKMLILTPIVLGSLCMMVIGFQIVKADRICDLNLSGMVDMGDIGRVAVAFGSQYGDPQWDSVADLDANGKVNMWDIGLVARQFGRALDAPLVIGPASETPSFETPPVTAPPFETPPTPPFETPPVTAPPVDMPPT